MSKDRMGIAVIAGVAVILIGGLLLKATLGGETPGRDNCTSAPSASTVFLLDHSEGVSAQTSREITDRVTQYALRTAAVNERITVYAVAQGSSQALLPVLSVCKPKADANRWVESEKVVSKRFKKNFLEPLEAALSRPMPKDSKESPLAQAITDITLTGNLRTARNRLVIFSDMLEHTKKFSMYKCTRPDQAVQDYLRSVGGSKGRPEFVNTHVDLNLIPRRDVSPTALKCRDTFWPWFFGASTGSQRQLVLDYLPG